MKIEPQELSIREVAENYVDNAEEGVVGYNGKLNVRPKYQREFVYNVQKRNAVIDTIRKGFPLNVMYWVVNDGGTFEILDGQQRTVSFCQYVTGRFSLSVDGRIMSFQNLTKTEQEQILDYKLMIYFCEGNDKEKLDWFRIVNIGGLKLTDQELRNAVYTGDWLTHAKTIFSKPNCGAYLLAKDYVGGSPIQQTFLETALKWITNGDIEKYMSVHQHDPNANELWTYFRNVIDWVKLIFTTYREEMKGVDWGNLYNEFHTQIYDTSQLEREIQGLMADDDIENKRGIYPYVLTRSEKHLNIRGFSESQKRTAYEKQNGICMHCGKNFELKKMEGDHITPWSKGGKTNLENCQMLCRECNRRKSSR